MRSALNSFYVFNLLAVLQDQSTILLLQTDAHNYKIIGILKQLKFRLSLRHVSVHAGTIIRELFRAVPCSTAYSTLAQPAGMPP